MQLPDNTPTEIEAFDVCCDRLAGFDDRLSTEWIDGYLTALAAGPRAVSPDEWLAAMCGETFERCFADPSDAQAARSALQARWRTLCRQLDPEALVDEPDALRLSPLMSVIEAEDRTKALAEGASADEVKAWVTGALWVHGFAAAMSDFERDWSVPVDEEDEEVLSELLRHLFVLVEPEDSDKLGAHVKQYYKADELPTRDDLIDAACFAVQDLRVWWLDHAAKPATRHVPPSPGRNDPCPCGSGRKYKKCHGAAAQDA